MRTGFKPVRWGNFDNFSHWCDTIFGIVFCYIAMLNSFIHLILFLPK